MVALRAPFYCRSIYHLERCNRLQVVEAVNIASPRDKRYDETSRHVLKFLLSDGKQYVSALELAPISIPSLVPAGLKLLLLHAEVARGLILLVPEGVKVLGGYVEELEEEAQRAREAMKRRFLTQA